MKRGKNSRHSSGSGHKRKSRKEASYRGCTTGLIQSSLKRAAKRWPKDSPPLRKKWIDARSNGVKGRLRWASKATSALVPIVTRLGECSWRRPCGSGVCARCTEIAGHQAFRLADRLFSKLTSKTQTEPKNTLIAFTVVLPGREIPRGRLADFDLVSWTRKFKRLCDKVDLGPLVGVIEFSFTEFIGGDRPPHITPHIHSIAITDNVSKLRRKLSLSLKRDDLTPRPTRVEVWHHTQAWTSYACKIDLVRRRVTREQERFNKITGEVTTCRGTNTAWLRSPELVELALSLHQLGLDRRFITRHCQFSIKHEKLRLRLSKLS